MHELKGLLFEIRSLLDSIDEEILEALSEKKSVNDDLFRAYLDERVLVLSSVSMALEDKINDYLGEIEAPDEVYEIMITKQSS